MRILVACEHSGVVRDAFAKAGHDAWSCDLLPSERGGPHYQCDVRDILGDDWDLTIAHPDCTFLTVANNGPMTHGCSLYTAQQARQYREAAVKFFMAMINAPCPRIVVENPIGIMSRIYRRPTQIIQPYDFGEDASKATCLWLKGLPKLTPTEYFPPRITSDGKKRWGNQTDSGQNKETPGPDRWKKRAKTYQGIADAMAAQYGPLLGEPLPARSIQQQLF